MMKYLTTLAALGVCAASQAMVWDSGSGLNWAIPDNSAQSFKFNVAGLVGTLTQIDIVFAPRLGHTFSGDLFLDMNTPGGSILDLLENPGAAVANSGASSRHLQSIWFGDTGANAEFWGTNSSPAVDSETTGTIYAHSTVFSPTLFSTISGAGLNGDWILDTGDIAAADTGTIDRVRLHTDAVPEPATMAILGLGAFAAARRRNRK